MFTRYLKSKNSHRKCRLFWKTKSNSRVSRRSDLVWIFRSGALQISRASARFFFKYKPRKRPLLDNLSSIGTKGLIYDRASRERQAHCTTLTAASNRCSYNITTKRTRTLTTSRLSANRTRRNDTHTCLARCLLMRDTPSRIYLIKCQLPCPNENIGPTLSLSRLLAKPSPCSPCAPFSHKSVIKIQHRSLPRRFIGDCIKYRDLLPFNQTYHV